MESGGGEAVGQSVARLAVGAAVAGRRWATNGGAELCCDRDRAPGSKKSAKAGGSARGKRGRAGKRRIERCLMVCGRGQGGDVSGAPRGVQPCGERTARGGAVYISRRVHVRCEC